MTDQRDPKMLPAYQRILNGQLISEGIYISMRDCQDLVGLISILEEENKKLNDDAKRVSNDIHTVIQSMSEDPDDKEENEYVDSLIKVLEELEYDPELLKSVRGNSHSETVKNILARVPEKYSTRRPVSTFIISSWISELFGGV